MNNDYVIFPMTFVLAVILLWCFWLNVVIKFMRRKRILWVEVQDCINQEYIISRHQAKRNLALINEVTLKQKTFSSMFDKFFYQYREITYLDGIKEDFKYIFNKDNMFEDQPMHIVERFEQKTADNQR